MREERKANLYLRYTEWAYRQPIKVHIATDSMIFVGIFAFLAAFRIPMLGVIVFWIVGSVSMWIIAYLYNVVYQERRSR